MRNPCFISEVPVTTSFLPMIDFFIPLNESAEGIRDIAIILVSEMQYLGISFLRRQNQCSTMINCKPLSSIAGGSFFLCIGIMNIQLVQHFKYLLQVLRSTFNANPAWTINEKYCKNGSIVFLRLCRPRGANGMIPAYLVRDFLAQLCSICLPPLFCRNHEDQ